MISCASAPFHHVFAVAWGWDRDPTAVFDGRRRYSCQTILPTDIAVPKSLSDLLDKIKISTSPTVSKGPTQDGEDVNTGNAAGKGSATPYQLPVLLDIARLALMSSGAGGAGGAGITPPKARSRALALDCLRLGLVLHLAPSEGDGLKDFRREALAVAAVGAKDERWEVRAAAARTAGEALRRTGGQKELVRLLSSKQVRDRERARGPFASCFIGGGCALPQQVRSRIFRPVDPPTPSVCMAGGVYS